MKNKVSFIGNDPGLTGASVFFDDNKKYIGMIRMPVKRKPGAPVVKNRINGSQLYSEIKIRFGDVTGAIAYLEYPKPIFKNGPIRIASLNNSIGIIDGVLSSLGCRIEDVDPETWKKTYNLIGKQKKESIVVANKLIPELGKILVKDADIAEAALIGLYGNKYLKPLLKNEEIEHDLF